MIVSEFLIGSAKLGVGSSLTLSGLAPVEIICASSISFLPSISTLITNDYFSNSEIRYTMLRDWNNVITLLYGKTLKESMIDKKIDQIEAEQLKQIYNHYLDKRKEIINSTEFKVENVFGNVINKHNISQDQIIKLNKFLAKTM